MQNSLSGSNSAAKPSSTVTSSSQFPGWEQQAFPATFSGGGGDDVSLSSGKWGTSNMSSTQSAWGSQSPSLTKQQSMSEWGAPSTTSMSSTQWGLPSAADSEDSWGQPKCLPNSGTDSWGMSAPSSSAANTSSSQSNPSSTGAQASQWGQPTSHSPPSSVWGSNSGMSNQQPSVSVPTAGGDSTASKQWGANTAAGQPNSTSSMENASSAFTSTNPAVSASTPTSWAGAAAKGLPKAQPKPPEPVDPVQLQIEQSINSPDGWGRMPIRQDTSWGNSPEMKKQDDSNQWQAAPNNGTCPSVRPCVVCLSVQPSPYQAAAR